MPAPGGGKSKIISKVGWGGDVPESTAQSPSTDSYDRLFTVPNLLSVLRLLGVPLFLWLLLGPHADVAALAVLALSGISDWADGVLARRLNQASRLGELLDPLADRRVAFRAAVRGS